MDSVPFPAGEDIETTLVLIKPDNFRFPNARPGGVIDLFLPHRLYIVGFKVHYMSVAQAEKFYGPVLDVLQDKFREPSAKRARLAIEEEFGFPLDEKTETELGELIGPIAGRSHWETIVQFMAGPGPQTVPRPSATSRAAKSVSPSSIRVSTPSGRFVKSSDPPTRRRPPRARFAGNLARP